MADLATGGGFDNVLDQLRSARGTVDQLNPEGAQAEKTIKDQGAKIIDIQSRLKQQTPVPEPPAAPDLPKAPKTEFSDPMKVFGNAAVVLSIFGSALTRAPLTTALNAAAAGMKAYHAGDKEALQKSQDDWRDAMEQALKQHQVEMEQYRAILEKRNQSVNETLAQLQGVAAATQNANMLAAIGSGRLSAAQQLVNTYQQQGHQLQELKLQRDQLDEQKRRDAAAENTPEREAYNTFLKENPNATAAEKAAFIKSQRGSISANPNSIALTKFLEENPDATAAQIADFNRKSRASPRSAPAMAMQKYMEEHPEATSEEITQFGAQYGARSKAVAAFATGKQGDIVRSFNVSIAHLDTLDKLANALQNNDMKAFNRIANAFAVQTGQPAPTNFDTAKSIVGNEIVKGIVGAAGTGEDRNKAQAAFDNANSPQALHEAAGIIRELVRGQLVGLKKQYEDTTGQMDFDSRLTGAARQELEKQGGTDTGAAKPLPPMAERKAGKTIWTAPDGSQHLWNGTGWDDL